MRLINKYIVGFGIILVSNLLCANENSSVNYKTMRIAADLSRTSYCDNSKLDECHTKELDPKLAVNIFANDEVEDVPLNSANTSNDLQASPLVKQDITTKSSKALSSIPEVSQTLAVYDADNNIAYIAIRGTVTILDWLLNVSATSAPFYGDENVRVHQGFNQYLISI